MRHQRILLIAMALAAGSTGLVGTPAGASAAADTCLGKPVTIVASTSVTTGTEGDDVVAMTPLGWNHFDARGGNDTICLDVGAPTGGRDPRPPVGVLDAGAGDDVVVNLATPDTFGALTIVTLGAGNDTFTGADLGENVYADEYLATLSVTPESALSGPQQDTITGASTVYSFAPSDGPNQDRIRFGSRGAYAVLDGPMGPQGSLDFTASTSGTLEILRPSGFAPPGPGDVAVDNVTRRVTVAGAQVLTWSGDIRSFKFGNVASPYPEANQRPVSFRGSHADEALLVTGLPVGDVSLRGGDDSLTVDRRDAFVPRSADGGAGDDSATMETACRSLTIRMEGSAACDGLSSPLTGFESVKATAERSGSSVLLVGTRARDRLIASGDHVAVRGRGGADTVSVDGLRVRTSGGPGHDVIVASGHNVVVRGGSGPDRLVLQGPEGFFSSNSTPPRTKRQVARGGRGADKLVGTTMDRPDRLIGGRGYDRANGRRGERDYCVAEVTKHCERP